MTIWRLVLKEILHRKLNFALGLVSVVAAVASLFGAMTLLGAYDARTEEILAAKEAETRKSMAALEDNMRKAMLGLGFNIVILPKSQNLGDWYAEDFAASTMPEEYVERLAKARIVTIQHLLPSLQQKVRWPEQKRSIILVGTRGEVPSPFADSKKPMVEPVPPGQIVLGYELHDALGLKVGDPVTLMGRRFTVRQWYPMRGNKDDITAWIFLPEAQEMLGKQGQINAILALECSCAWADLPKVREEIGRILPDTQVVERGSEALARAEARRKAADTAKEMLAHEAGRRAALRAEYERYASILVPAMMLAAAAWVGLLALVNVRERRSEIGILRAIGLRGRQVLTLFLSKALLTGILGGAIGCAMGYVVGRWLGASIEGATARGILDLRYAVLALAVAPVLSVAASWIPALVAAQQDPALILHEE